MIGKKTSLESGSQPEWLNLSLCSIVNISFMLIILEIKFVYLPAS